MHGQQKQQSSMRTQNTSIYIYTKNWFRRDIKQPGMERLRIPIPFLFPEGFLSGFHCHIDMDLDFLPIGNNNETHGRKNGY